jgi:hypothetical protein
MEEVLFWVTYYYNCDVVIHVKVNQTTNDVDFTSNLVEGVGFDEVFGSWNKIFNIESTMNTLLQKA